MSRTLKVTGLTDEEYDLIQELRSTERRLTAAIIAEAVQLYHDTYYDTDAGDPTGGFVSQ